VARFCPVSTETLICRPAKISGRNRNAGIASDAGTGLRIDAGGGDVLFVEDFYLARFDAGDVII
jgi:hypothetical protein